jgi:hypothetical protein
LCEPAAFNSHDSAGPISIVPGQLQEESVKVWKELFIKLGSPEELQAKLESNDTSMVRALGEEFIRTKVLPKTQLKRLIKPEEISPTFATSRKVDRGKPE